MWRTNARGGGKSQGTPTSDVRMQVPCTGGQTGLSGEEARAASSAFTQDREEPQAERIREDQDPGQDADVCGLVEYGIDDHHRIRH